MHSIVIFTREFYGEPTILAMAIVVKPLPDELEYKHGEAAMQTVKQLEKDGYIKLIDEYEVLPLEYLNEVVGITISTVCVGSVRE